MAIDPSDYDVVGVRELALSPDPGRSDGTPGSRAAEGGPSLEEFAEFDRRSQWLGSNDERHKPYLRRIPRRNDLRDPRSTSSRLCLPRSLPEVSPHTTYVLLPV